MRNKHKIPTKFFAILLAVIMVVGMVPATVFAIDDPLSGNTGSGWDTVGGESPGDSSDLESGGNVPDKDEVRDSGTPPDDVLDSEELPNADDADGAEKVRQFNEMLKQYQEWADTYMLTGAKGRSAGVNVEIVKIIPLAGTIKWYSGYPDSPYMMSVKIPHIKVNGVDSFCFDFNGQQPSGDYKVGGTYKDAALLKVLANYHANPSDEAYIATQFAVWQFVTTGSIALDKFIQWGGCVSPGVLDSIFNGTASYDGKAYTLYVGGAQDIITFADASDVEDKYALKIIKKDKDDGKSLANTTFTVTGPSGFIRKGLKTNSSGEILVFLAATGTYTVTETAPPPGYLLASPNTKTVEVTEAHTKDNPAVVEFENEKNPDPGKGDGGEAFGQVTVIKKDDHGNPIKNAIFNIEVEFSDGSTGGNSRFQVVNGSNTYTYAHPAKNYNPARVTVTEVSAPPGYIIDKTPKTLTITPTYYTYEKDKDGILGRMRNGDIKIQVYDDRQYRSAYNGGVLPKARMVVCAEKNRAIRANPKKQVLTEAELRALLVQSNMCSASFKKLRRILRANTEAIYKDADRLFAMATEGVNHEEAAQLLAKIEGYLTAIRDACKKYRYKDENNITTVLNRAIHKINAMQGEKLTVTHKNQGKRALLVA